MKFYTVAISLCFAFLFGNQAKAEVSAKRSGTLTIEEVGAAVGTLGDKAAVGLTKAIAKIFSEKGQPSALIVGDEIQGSFIVGYRTGSGKAVFPGESVQNSKAASWSAPSIGINAGVTMSKVAILVYGANSVEQLRQNYGSIQGSYHFIAGASVSYLNNNVLGNSGTTVQLVYVSVGVGLDAGFAAEYLTIE